MFIEIILGAVILVECYVIWNLMRKTEVLETWVEEFTELIESVNSELKITSKSWLEIVLPPPVPPP